MTQILVIALVLILAFALNRLLLYLTDKIGGEPDDPEEHWRITLPEPAAVSVEYIVEHWGANYPAPQDVILMEELPCGVKRLLSEHPVIGPCDLKSFKVIDYRLAAAPCFDDSFVQIGQWPDASIIIVCRDLANESVCRFDVNSDPIEYPCVIAENADEYLRLCWAVYDDFLSFCRQHNVSPAEGAAVYFNPPQHLMF